MRRKARETALVQSRIYERDARSQCREIANTINVDLISFRAFTRKLTAIWKNLRAQRARNKRER